MKPHGEDDLWPRPQWYSIVCPQCGRPAARLVYQEPVARYLHYSRSGFHRHREKRQENDDHPPVLQHYRHSVIYGGLYGPAAGRLGGFLDAGPSGSSDRQYAYAV